MARTSGGTYVYDQIDGSSVNNIIDGLEEKLTTAGWTSTALPAKVTLTYTGQPADNTTITINGVAYQADNTPAGATQFQIGADATATYTDMKTIVEANDANIDITVSGSGASGTVTIAWATAGTAGNGTAVTEALANATLDLTAMRYGGYMLRSAKTAHGLEMKVRVWDGNGVVHVTAHSIEGDVVSQNYRLDAATSRTLEVIACRYQAWVFLLGSSTTVDTVCCWGVPYIYDHARATAVTSIADNGSGLVRVTETAHGRVTGEHVFIAGGEASGSPFATVNGYHQITVNDANTYDLDGSTYAGGYDASSAWVAGQYETSRAFWIQGDNPARAEAALSFRRDLAPYTNSSANHTYQTVCQNQYSYDWSVSGAGSASLRVQQLMTPKTAGLNEIINTVGFDANGCPMFFECPISWPVTSSASTKFVIGDLWNAAIIGYAYPKDKQVFDYQSFNWMVFSDAAPQGALLLITTAV